MNYILLPVRLEVHGDQAVTFVQAEENLLDENKPHL
jgi:hypothetical protein